MYLLTLGLIRQTSRIVDKLILYSIGTQIVMLEGIELMPSSQRSFCPRNWSYHQVIGRSFMMDFDLNLATYSITGVCILVSVFAPSLYVWRKLFMCFYRRLQCQKTVSVQTYALVTLTYLFQSYGWEFWSSTLSVRSIIFSLCQILINNTHI